MSKSGKELYEFSRFRLDVSQRLLLRDGKHVPLADKAFDTLCVLVRQNGGLVGKDDLMREVWRDSIVEENNLDQKISLLRQALGDTGKGKKKFIETVRGHGYRFIPEVNVIRNTEELETIYAAADFAERKIAPAGRHFRTTRTGTVLALAKWPSDEGKHDEKFPAQSETSARTATGDLVEIIPVSTKHFKFPLQYSLWLKTRGVIISLGLFLAAAAITILYFQQSPATAVENSLTSLAVLPFKSLVADTQDEMLEIGIAEALIGKLSGLSQLNIRPISAVKKYNSLQRDAAAIGKELKVDAVLEGHIQKIGDRIRVTARLLRVSDGKVFWTEQFDEQSGDIFAVQDRVAPRVVESLKIYLSKSDQSVFAKRQTENAEAYKIYLRGRYHWNKRTPDGLQKSIEDFRSAIDLDPLFALAYAGVADSYILQSLYGAKPAHDVMPKARAAAERALEIDPQLAEAHASIALVKFLFDYDWAGAEENFRRSIELKPNYATARQWYGSYLMMSGRNDEAIASLERAGELDPLSLSINTDIALAYYFARRHEDAVGQLNKTLELDPNYFNAHLHLGLNFAAQKKFEEAIAEFEAVKNLTGGEHAIAELAWVYALSGKYEEARQILRNNEAELQSRHVSPTTAAGVYAALGEKEKAFERLYEAYKTRDGFLLSIKVDPMFNPLRDDPRFAELMKRMNFE